MKTLIAVALMIGGIVMFTTDLAQLNTINLAAMPSSAVSGGGLFFLGMYLWFRGILIH